MNNQIFEEIFSLENIEEDQNFQRDQILQNLQNFWNLDDFLKTKYLLNIELVLEKITINKLSDFVINVFHVDKKKLNDNTKITNLILQQLDNILNFIQHCQIEEKELNIIQQQFQIQLIELFSKVIESQNKLIRNESRNVLVNLKQYFSDSICNRQLLTLFLTSIHDNIQIENQIWGVQMLAQFYSKFDINTVQGFISQELLALTEDHKMLVRKEAFKTLFEILRIDSNSSLKRQMLFLVQKMIVDENLEIQSSFCQNLPTIVHIMSYKQFEKIIIMKYLELLNGVSHRLHFICLKNLGAILKELIQKPNSEDLKLMISSDKFDELFKIYFQIPDFVKSYSKYEQKIIFKENFQYFQFIIQLKKVNIWNSIKFFLYKIEGLDIDLVCYCKYQLSNQFVSLINVLDENNSYQLLNILDDQYLNKNAKCNLKIQIQLLSTFINILQQIKQKKRDQYISLYINLLRNNQTQWRFRFVLSKQIDQFIQTFSSDILITKVVFLIFRLCQDQAAIVRKTAAKQVYKLLLKKTEQKFIEVTCIHIYGFGKSKNFQFRQVFLIIMKNIFLNVQEINIPEDLMQLFDNFFEEKVYNNLIMFLKILNEIQYHYDVSNLIIQFCSNIDKYNLAQQIEIYEILVNIKYCKQIDIKKKMHILKNYKKNYLNFFYDNIIKDLLFSFQQ